MDPEYKEVQTLTGIGFEYYKYPKGLEYRKSASGFEEWWKDGKLHRLDGPAVKYKNGYDLYNLEGARITKEDFDHAWTCPMRELPLLINKDTALIAKWRLERGY